MAVNRARSREGGCRLAARSGALMLLALGVGAPAQVRAQTHAGQYELADIEYGARLYAGHCVTCHGEGGDMMPGANLSSGQFRNAPTDRDLSTLIRSGLPGTAMTATAYTDSEITALVAYLRNMGRVDLSAAIEGDPVRGRELFEGKGDCGSCHRVNGHGPRFAPDLSNVGAMRSAGMLQRTLLEPSAAMLPINRPVRAVMRDGSVINGRRLNEDTHTVQIIDDRERLISLEKSRLRELAVSMDAAMPSYADTFTEHERADLVAYLLSLKGTVQ